MVVKKQTANNILNQIVAYIGTFEKKQTPKNHYTKAEGNNAQLYH